MRINTQTYWFAAGFMTRVALCLLVINTVESARAQEAASPPPFTIELTAQEGALIAGMLDQAIKQGGYASAKQITPIMDKMIAASNKAQTVANEAAKKAEYERMKADEAKKP